MTTTRPGAEAPPAPALGGGAVLVATGALLWGTGGVAAATITAHSAMSPTAVSALRLLLGGLAVLGVTAVTGQLRAIPRTAASARHVLLTAALAAVFGAAYFQSVVQVGVAVATVVALGGAPLVVAAHGTLRARRLPRLPVLVALAASVAGLALVGDVRRPADAGGDAGWGVALALVAAVAFGATTVVNRRVLPGLAPAPLVATAFTLAGLASLVPAAPAGLALGSLDATAWVTLAFLALVQTAVGYLAFYAGLQRGVSATSAALLSLLEPVGATVLAVAVLGEHVTPAAAVGIGLVLGAVLLARDRPAGATAAASSTTSTTTRTTRRGPRGRRRTAPRSDAPPPAAA
ncbi:DMT family transporter [Isoptericola sp. NPDC057653]|uniref:DMT family transporter n=1 Tax=Isoptericola sp. NPDC057653 TaxID=3346195 RepID=UPI0036CE6314